jgi:hypothetical protein
MHGACTLLYSAERDAVVFSGQAAFSLPVKNSTKTHPKKSTKHIIATINQLKPLK